MTITRVSVVGAGAWGTALALIAQRGGCTATLQVRRPELAETLRTTRRNADYLPGIELPAEIAITPDLTAALAADAVLYAQPAQHFRAFCQGARPHWQGAALVLCAKGIEQSTGKLLHEIAAEELPGVKVAALSGPSFAIDVAHGLPTAVAIAAEDAALVERLMAALSHGAFRPYGARDLVGTEVAGAVKNVYAIACGLAIGSGLGDNARPRDAGLGRGDAPGARQRGCGRDADGPRRPWRSGSYLLQPEIAQHVAGAGAGSGKEP